MLKIMASFPRTISPSTAQRLDLYQRLRYRHEAMLAELQAEIIDRFGGLPRQ